MPSAENLEIIVPDREPWDKLPNESAKAFAAFAHYRDTPVSERSLLNTARHLVNTIPERTRNVESVRVQISEWSRKWRWVERVEAWEVYEDRRRRLERAAAQRTMEERHLAGANRALIASLQRMAGDQQNGIQALSPNQIEDWGEATQVLERAVRIGRLTMGLPTDLMRSMDTWPASEVIRVVHAVMDTILPYIPEEAQYEATAQVQEMLHGWGRR